MTLSIGSPPRGRSLLSGAAQLLDD